jgi:hypothetical protein
MAGTFLLLFFTIRSEHASSKKHTEHSQPAHYGKRKEAQARTKRSTSGITRPTPARNAKSKHVYIHRFCTTRRRPRLSTAQPRHPACPGTFVHRSARPPSIATETCPKRAATTPPHRQLSQSLQVPWVTELAAHHHCPAKHHQGWRRNCTPILAAQSFSDEFPHGFFPRASAQPPPQLRHHPAPR